MKDSPIEEQGAGKLMLVEWHQVLVAELCSVSCLVPNRHQQVETPAELQRRKQTWEKPSCVSVNFRNCLSSLASFRQLAFNRILHQKLQSTIPREPPLLASPTVHGGSSSWLVTQMKCNLKLLTSKPGLLRSKNRLPLHQTELMRNAKSPYE